jgi:hypothetical protein
MRGFRTPDGTRNPSPSQTLRSAMPFPESSHTPRLDRRPFRASYCYNHWRMIAATLKTLQDFRVIRHEAQENAARQAFAACCGCSAKLGAVKVKADVGASHPPTMPHRDAVGNPMSGAEHQGFVRRLSVVRAVQAVEVIKSSHVSIWQDRCKIGRRRHSLSPSHVLTSCVRQ